MNRMSSNAAMLWTGGKDSAMAMHEATMSGYGVRCLVTLTPPDPQFLAHPIPFLRMQGKALEMPHHVLTIHEPIREGYETVLRWLKESLDIDTVITGDIAEVAGHPNWIRERSVPSGMNVFAPLWGRERLGLLRNMLAARFKIVISCVREYWLDEHWVGRELDETAIGDLCEIHERMGLDLCGENGEYHTLVTDGPQFRKGVRLQSYSTRSGNGLTSLEIHGLELFSKSPCVGSCQLDDEDQLCSGCARSKFEIAKWSQLTEAERLQVLASIETRKAAP
jgi:diphthine-ammonia ligase